MAIRILTPEHSFIRFDGAAPFNHCIFGVLETCLPVYDDGDVAFQFVAETDTSEEADTLCKFDESGLVIGLVRDCDAEDENFDVEFNQAPQRYRISPLQVLYNWEHGMPGMAAEINIGECFYIRIYVVGVEGNFATACSNCFKRIANACFTSVIEYGNDENFAGFNYCNSAAVASADPSASCQPEVISFTDKLTLDIPYTAGRAALYGEVPTVQAWIYDGADLVNAGIEITLIGTPVNMIHFDFGGMASGEITIG